MKNAMLLMYAALLLGLGTPALPAQTPLPPPTIEVTSKAEISVEPDSATIVVDLTKTNKDLNTARSENEKGVASVIAIAKKYAIPATDIRTRNISVTMKYTFVRDKAKPIYDEDGDEIGAKTFVGYEVSRNVTLTLKDLSKFDALFNDVLGANPTEIESVSFETSRLVELRKQAREMAMKAAQDKARYMTAAIGQTIGRAIRINEGTSSDRYVSVYSNVMSNTTQTVVGERPIIQTSNMGTFSAGSVNVEATVTIVFLLN